MMLKELDGKLQRLRAAADRIHADLLDIEQDHTRRLLDDAELEGESARRWAATSAALLELWEGHGLLTGLLERAERLRGTRAHLRAQLLAELGELIEGASIRCSSQFAVAERDRPGNSHTIVRSSPAELVERMSAGVEQAKVVLAQFGNAWKAVDPHLRHAQTLVGESAALCQSVGESKPDELDRAHQRLTELIQDLAKDPLSVKQSKVEALKTSVAALRADLQALAELRDEIGARLAEARGLLAELNRAQEECEAAHAEVLVKIAAPTVPEPVTARGVEAELEQVVELSEAGAWRQTRDALAQWTTRASSLLEKARRTVAANRDPIEARDQLRGRLDAFQAKANRLGLIEDPELADIFERAQATLYTAPTDLARAETLVCLYQQGLAGTVASEEVVR